VVYPVLEFMKKKRTFVKIEGGKVDFFLGKKSWAAASGAKVRPNLKLVLLDQPNQPTNWAK
jgi:hypothetical protein